MKTLTIVSAGLGRPDRAELAQKEASDQHPRSSLYERVLESEMLDEKFLETAPKFSRLIYKRLPVLFAQVIEAFIIRNRYDIVISWAERLGYPLALLLKLTGSKTPHITLNSWITKSKKAKMLKFVNSHIDRILLWSSVQRDFAVNNLKIPSSKIAFVRKFADQQFWRPLDVPMDMICAAGAEMRDYPTLIEALRGLDIKCHIAAGKVRGKLTHTIAAISQVDEIPQNVTVGPKSYSDLRDLYARSRFVVVPLLQTDTDNGLTCILESMAMGKAVICSRTRGQVDVIQEGKTGIFVPQGDPKALREAILHLWNHPEIAETMGRAARKYIEENHSIEQFVNSVRRIAEEVIKEKHQKNHSAGSYN
jgi:glycosyltransferase involved in cell wall biosynthesis